MVNLKQIQTFDWTLLCLSVKKQTKKHTMQFHIQFSSSHYLHKASKPSMGQKDKGGTKASDEVTKQE